MHNIKNNTFHFTESCKKDIKLMQDNYSSTSLKEDSSKKYDESEKNSTIMQNFEFNGNKTQLESLNEINLGLKEKSDFRPKQINNENKNLFLGKKPKIKQVHIINESQENKLINFNKKNEATKIDKHTKNQIKPKKSMYSVFKINLKTKNAEKNKDKNSIDSNKNFEKEGVNKHFSFTHKKSEVETIENKLNKSLSSSEKSSIDLDLESSLSAYESDCDLSSFANHFRLDKRVSAFSKVNFTKLSEPEKAERLKNLAKMVKRLRRKVGNLQNRFRSNANKILNKYLCGSLGIKKNSKSNQAPLDFDIDKLGKALKLLRQYERFEYTDQKFVIENFINLIAEEKIQLDSINFTKICTQIRMFLDNESYAYIANKGQKITFSFPEKDVDITAKEYELYSKYRDREDVIRTIIGVPEEEAVNIYPERINFVSKKLQEIKEINSSMNLKNNNNNDFNSNSNFNNIKSFNGNDNLNSLSNVNSILNPISPGQNLICNSDSINNVLHSLNQKLPNFALSGNDIGKINSNTGNALQQFSNNQQQVNFPNLNNINNIKQDSANQQKIFEHIKSIHLNNCNLNEIMKMNYNCNPPSISPCNNNYQNLLINSMYSNILQNFTMPKNN